MTDAAELHTLADGRRVAFSRYGDPAGRPVVMLHGTPGSRLLFTAADGPARTLGLSLIAPDRWAYGGSDATDRPVLADYADDIGGLMTALGHRRFAVCGFSGGGPYAAAAAARLGDRVTAAALVSPVGLVADSLSAGELGLFHRFCFGTLARRPKAVEGIFRVYRAAVARAPRLSCGLMTFKAPRADKRIIADCAVSARLMTAFGDGMRLGTRGPAIDLALFGSPWGIELGGIAAPSRVWIGTRDGNVPVPAAHRLAAAMPGCELTVLEGEGHLWVAHHYGDVLGWVAAVQGTAGVAHRSRFDPG